MNCSSLLATSSSSVEYCVEKEVQNPSTGRIVYFFHGIYGSAKDWQNTELRKHLVEYHQTHKIPYPTIVSISFGKAWFVTDVSWLSSRSRKEQFQNVILPSIEKNLNVTVKSRVAVGISMGGYNALTSFAGPQVNSKIQASVGLCPATLPIGPYSSIQETEAFFANSKDCINRDLYETFTMKAWGRFEFPSRDDWERNMLSSLALNRSLSHNQMIVTNSCDEWGFHVGASSFMKFLQNNPNLGIQLTYLVEPESRHCSFSPQTLKNVARYINLHLER